MRMIEHGDGERTPVRLIRLPDLVRVVAQPAALANDNRRRIERDAVALARIVVAGAPPRPVAPSRPAPPSTRPPSRCEPAALPACTWPAGSWMPWGAAWADPCRWPPLVSGLALWRAWGALGIGGAAGCAGLAATGVELLGATLLALAGSTSPARSPSAPR